MIKEIWTLAKMLFMGSPHELEEVRLMQMEHFPRRGTKYMSWCGRIVYRKDSKEDRRKEWISKEYRARKQADNLLLEQAKQYGSWAKFYWKYFLGKL